MSGLDIGSMDRLVSIERGGVVRNGVGDDVDGFTAGPTVWASARPGGGRERLVSAQTAAEAPMVFRIHWQEDLADLSPTDRVNYNGRLYDIVSVQEIGRRAGLELATTARA